MQVALVALPVLIVAIPWAVNHVLLCLLVTGTIALSPFGTVLLSMLPSKGKAWAPQQQRRRQSSQPPWLRTSRARPFWPAEVRHLSLLYLLICSYITALLSRTC